MKKQGPSFSIEGYDSGGVWGKSLMEDVRMAALPSTGFARHTVHQESLLDSRACRPVAGPTSLPALRSPAWRAFAR